MMRLQLFLFVLFAACDTTPTEPVASPCDDLMEAGDCMTDDNFIQCQEAFAECGNEVFIMESCPLQFGC